MNAYNEQDLIEKCQDGDPKAFGPLMQIYRRQLYSYLFKLSGDKTEAEDLFQETLIKTWKGIKKYSHNQKFASWFFTIAHNTAMDNLRSRKRNSVITNFEPDEIYGVSNPHQDLVKKEVKEIINKAVGKLSERQKEVFLLRVHGELTFKEIADITSEPLNTVLSHMHYALGKVKKYLGNNYE